MKNENMKPGPVELTDLASNNKKIDAAIAKNQPPQQPVEEPKEKVFILTFNIAEDQVDHVEDSKGNIVIHAFNVVEAAQKFFSEFAEDPNAWLNLHISIEEAPSI